MYIKKDVLQIIEYIESHGAKVYIVGGFVRDYLLNRSSSDVDLEVYNINPSLLLELLKKKHEIKFIPKFGVIKFAKNPDIEITFPRKEINKGLGHRDFDVSIDPYLDTYNACKRRDFTINTMMYDCENKKFIDHFNAMSDLKNKKLKMVGPHFCEDPLRVYRMIRFSTILKFEIESETLKMASKIDLCNVSKSRIENEVIKILKDKNYRVGIGLLAKKEVKLKYYNNLETRIMQLASLQNTEIYEKKSYKKIVNLYKRSIENDAILQIICTNHSTDVKKEMIELIVGLKPLIVEKLVNKYLEFQYQNSSLNLISQGCPRHQISKMKKERLEAFIENFFNKINDIV